MDFRGFDSSGILILRSGILMSIRIFPETLSPQILVGIILVGRLGEPALCDSDPDPDSCPIPSCPISLLSASFSARMPIFVFLWLLCFKCAS